MNDVEILKDDLYLFNINHLNIMYDARRGIFGEEQLLYGLIERPQINESSIAVKHDDFIIRSVVLHISDKCSLNCEYCYLNTMERPIYNLKKENIDEICSYILENTTTSNEVVISFLGGEPLEEFDLVKYTVSKLKFKSNKFKFAISTNGLLLDKEKFEFMEENNFISVVISLDGDKNSHDTYRKLKSGKGSYNIVSNNIKSNSTKLRFDIQSVIPKNVEENSLIDMVVHHMQYNPKSIKIYLESSEKKWTQERIEATKKAIHNLWMYFLDNLEKGIIIPLKHNISLINKLYRGKKAYFNCDAGTTSIYIGNNNKVYPCNKLAFNNKWEIGKIDDKTLNRSAIIENNVQKREKCKQCWCRYICGGKCYADDSNNCEVIEFDIMMAMYAYIYIHNNCPKIFSKIISQTRDISSSGYIRDFIKDIK